MRLTCKQIIVSNFTFAAMCRADSCLEFCWSRSNPRLLNSEQSQRQQSAWWNIIETNSKFELKFFSFFGSISEATLSTFVIIHCRTFIRPFLQATPAVVKPWSFRFSKIDKSISLNLCIMFKWLYSAAIWATLSPSVVFVSMSSAFVTVSRALVHFQIVKKLFEANIENLAFNFASFDSFDERYHSYLTEVFLFNFKCLSEVLTSFASRARSVSDQPTGFVLARKQFYYYSFLMRLFSEQYDYVCRKSERAKLYWLFNPDQTYPYFAACHR